MPKNIDVEILGVKIGTYESIDVEDSHEVIITFNNFTPNNYIKRTYLDKIDYENLFLEFNVLSKWARLYVNQDSKGIDQKVIDIDMYDVITQTYNILKNYGEKCL